MKSWNTENPTSKNENWEYNITQSMLNAETKLYT